MWRLGGFGLLLNVEYGFCKKISAVYGFYVATRLGKIGIKRAVYRFLLTSKNLLLDNCHCLSGLRIAVTKQSFANGRFRRITLGILFHLLVIARGG